MVDRLPRIPRLSTERNGDGHYGVVAEGYDVYLEDVDFNDDAVWRDLLAGTARPALELGCGTGRVLLCSAGFEVEGLASTAFP